MGRGLNISAAHQQNRSLLLRMILQNPRTSRAKLAEMTQLTPASVSNITGILIKERYIQETGTLHDIRSVGRRSIGLTIRNGTYFTIAVHMQRQQATIGLGQIDGTVTNLMPLPIPDHPNPVDLARNIAAVIKVLVRDVSASHILGIGVGTSGIVDTEAGTVYAALAYQWQDVAWSAILSQETGLPVAVDNNARGMALAEMLFGGSTQSPWLTFLFVGQGIGLGVLADGQVFGGGNGIGGELGHTTINWKGETCWCGNVGCLETYLNQTRIESFLGVREDETIAVALQRSYQHGTYFDIIDLVSTALVTVINMFNPQVIVLGGWVGDVWSLIETEVQQQVKGRTRFWNEPAPDIRPSSFGGEVGIRGANAVALGKWVYGLGLRGDKAVPAVMLTAPEEIP